MCKNHRMTETIYEGSDLEVLADMPNYYSWIMSRFAPQVRGAVLEYGAGMGTISAHLLPLSTRLTLVEPSPNLSGPLRARFAGVATVDVVHETLESHVVKIEPASVDTIVLVNVLEHIEDDRAALRRLMAALRPGGHLLLFVPALQFLMSDLDRELGHFRRYHRPELAAKVTASGGVVEVCRYMDLIGVMSWFLLNTLLGSTKFNPKMVAINDRAVVPLSRALERVAAPFGKNLILVARKP